RAQVLFASVAAMDYQPGLAQDVTRRQILSETLRTLKSEQNMTDVRMQEDIVRGLQASLRSTGENQGPTLRQMLLRGQYEESIRTMVELTGSLRAARDRRESAAPHAWAGAGEFGAVFAQVSRA